MADTLALVALYNAVVAQFSADSTNTPNLFGWRKKAQQLTTGRRIVWVPGDDSSSSVGALRPPRKEGSPPRSIATLDELVTVYIHSGATLPADSENETVAYTQARLLFDAWFRAVYRFAHGAFDIISARWVTDKTERREGATIRCVMAISAMIPDRPLGINDPIQDYPIAQGLSAELTVTELDHSETLSVEIPAEP